MTVTGLSGTFYVDLAGTFKSYKIGNKFVMISVENLTGWTVGRATRDNTTDPVIQLLEQEIIYHPEPPKRMVSENLTCFKLRKLDSFVNARNIHWSIVMESAPMRNWLSERMVGTRKKSISKNMLTDGSDWEEALKRSVYGQRIKEGRKRMSPFELMYGTALSLMNDEVHRADGSFSV